MSEATFGIRLNWFGKDAESGTRKIIDNFRAVRDEAARTGESIALSAKQQSFALRQVPMQFTDIATSLASGQPPMMVLLQQGGQLKDIFGGVAPAVGALGGYIASLINPLTVSVAAAAALGTAFAQGAAESEKLQRAIIMTGGAMGASYSDLTAQAKQASEATGKTRAAAAEAITALVSTGLVVPAELNKITEATLRLDSVGAQSMQDSVKQFAELGKAPVEASLKLNEQFHYLTESSYRQIKALQDMGREDEAAALAQRTYAQAMSDRAAEVSQNLGLIERAANLAASAGKSMWDALLDLGRKGSLSEQLAIAQAQLERLKGSMFDFQLPSWMGPSLGDTVRDLEQRVSAEKKVTEEKEAANRKNQAGITWDQQSVQLAGNRQKRELEIAKARQLGLEAGKSELEIQQRIAQINAKYKDPVKEKTDRQKSNDLIAQYERENQLTLDRIERSNELTLMSARERAIAEAQYKAEDQAQSMRERVISSLKSEAEEKRALLAIDERLEEQKSKIADYTATAYDSSRTFEFGWNKAMQQFADDSTNYAKIAQTSVGNFVDSTATAMGNWAAGRKANFADVFTSLAAYLVKIQLMAGGTALLNGLFGQSGATSPTDQGTRLDTGGAMSNSAVMNAHGNVFSGAPTLSQYSNSLLTGPTLFGFDKLHAFATGGAFGVGGEAGTEAVMPLTRVGNDLGVRAMIKVVGSGSTSGPKVTINNYNQSSNAQVESRQTTDANGDISIENLIVDTVNTGIAKGNFNSAFKNAFNLKRAPR